MSAELVCSGRSQRECVPFLSRSFWSLPAIVELPDLQTYLSNLCLHLHTRSSLYMYVCLCLFSSSCKDTNYTGLKLTRIQYTFLLT